MNLFKKFFKHHAKLDTITLGEEFPYKEHIQPGDFTRPILTAEKIDVVISLTNLSDQERDAIGNQPFEIFIQETVLAPMVALRFGNVFTCDFSLNLAKMDKDYVNIWLNSENSTMTIYLLEGLDSTLQCVRYVPFRHMNVLKQFCERQLQSTPHEIDNWISMCNSRYSSHDIIANAKLHDVIPAVKFSI